MWRSSEQAFNTMTEEDVRDLYATTRTNSPAQDQPPDQKILKCSSVWQNILTYYVPDMEERSHSESPQRTLKKSFTMQFLEEHLKSDRPREKIEFR